MVLESHLILRRFANEDALAEEVAGLLASYFAHSSEDLYGLVLSGGTTPIPAYERLVRYKVQPNPTLRIFFSDERFVPWTSSLSNYGRIRPLLVRAGIPEGQIIPVPVEMSLEQAAGWYNAKIEEFFRAGGRLLLALLGIGSDGHTASLFSLADLERGKDRFVIPVVRETKPHRISTTPLLYQRVARTVVLASGKEKAEIFAKFMADPSSTIAGMALANVPTIEVWASIPDRK